MVNMVNSVTPVTYQRCGSNYPAPSSRNGELNAEGNSHAQDQRHRRCCCIVPDWRWSMDWRRNMDFDRCACWFDHRSILDDGECKEPRTTSIEPPVAKQAQWRKRQLHDQQFYGAVILAVFVAHDKAGVVVFIDRAAGSGERTLLVVACCVTGPDFGTPGEPVVIVSNSQHDRLSLALFHRFCQGSHFLTPLTPIFGIIGQGCQRQWVASQHSYGNGREILLSN